MNRKFMDEAVRLSKEGSATGQGGPFGCVIVKDDKIVGKGYNKVSSTNDPTAHAEVVAIRDACKNLNSFQLEGCEIYTSCEPCPMCLASAYWARVSRIVYANTRDEAAAIGFDDAFIYDEVPKDPSIRSLPMEHHPRDDARAAFAAWAAKPDKIRY